MSTIYSENDFSLTLYKVYKHLRPFQYIYRLPFYLQNVNSVSKNNLVSLPYMFDHFHFSPLQLSWQFVALYADCG
jgi:hypothetical protein